jgi:hypothetical protein
LRTFRRVNDEDGTTDTGVFMSTAGSGFSVHRSPRTGFRAPVQRSPAIRPPENWAPLVTRSSTSIAWVPMPSLRSGIGAYRFVR